VSVTYIYMHILICVLYSLKHHGDGVACLYKLYCLRSYKYQFFADIPNIDTH
jgi:hypothetical protein